MEVKPSCTPIFTVSIRGMCGPSVIGSLNIVFGFLPSNQSADDATAWMLEEKAALIVLDPYLLRHSTLV